MKPAVDYRELLELAVLDAMGLLDEQEQARFELALRASPPAIQSQVRREQLRFANIEGLYPKVEPPAELRAAVLDAVRRAVETERAGDEAAPIPMPAMLPSRGVNPVWRAAALGLLAASVTFGVLTFQLIGQYERMGQQLRSDSLLAQLGEKFGQGFVRDVLFDRDTSRVVLARSKDNFSGEAALFMNPEWKTAKFFCSGMPSPEGQPLRLALLDAQGNVVRVIKEFQSLGGLEGLDIELHASTSGELAVMVSAEGGESATILCRAPLPNGQG